MDVLHLDKVYGPSKSMALKLSVEGTSLFVIWLLQNSMESFKFADVASAENPGFIGVQESRNDNRSVDHELGGCVSLVLTITLLNSLPVSINWRKQDMI